MPAPIGTASIAFGLVNVPVRIYPATQDHDIRFHMVHTEDGGRVRYDYVCTVCGNSVQYYDIDRAYESPRRVIVTDDDLAQLPAVEKSEILVLQFVPTEQIDPILLHRSYFLEAEPVAASEGEHAGRAVGDEGDRPVRPTPRRGRSGARRSLPPN